MKMVLDACSGRHPAARLGARDALHQVSLTVGSGEQVAIIGPSGAGKTTLLHLMACALLPVQGRLLIDDRNPWSLSTRDLQKLRGTLFLAPQVPPLPPRQRVVTAVLAARLPNWGFWRSLRSLFYPVDIEVAHTALAHFDLTDKLFERVDRLSGGERQRVGLARLMASQARLLLVDEPLSALDPERSRQAVESLTHLAQERGATLVATLHHVEMALQHFPRIIGLREGELFFDLPAAEVTPERLQDLYASHLSELTEPAPPPIYPVTLPTPVVTHCR